MIKRYGLIGFPLQHSFSARYFAEKFEREGIDDARYDLYELADIDELPHLVARFPELRGLNVTIPHKSAVMRYLDEVDETAAAIGAVNTLIITPDGRLKGFNTDVYGFTVSLKHWLGAVEPLPAVVLGSGGSSKAVAYGLQKMGVQASVVSRHPVGGQIGYDDLYAWLATNRRALLVNTTPLGMYPAVQTCPPVPWGHIGEGYFVYDLVYNPSETLLLQRARQRGAQVKNGLEMLHLQAERAWWLWQHA